MKVLIISPHPDDETLGCGGTLLKHRERGDKVFWLIMTSISEDLDYTESKINTRESEIQQAAGAYEIEDFFNLDYPTTKLDTLPIGDVVSDISRIIDRVEPNSIYLPNRSDIHTDHEITFRAAMSALKSFRKSSVDQIAMYETISETEFGSYLAERAFQPNMFVDITDFIEGKKKIAKIYDSEIGQHPFPRSERNIEALATFRGATMGAEYAESFMLLRKFW